MIYVFCKKLFRVFLCFTYFFVSRISLFRVFLIKLYGVPKN
jgi:hypothetical protein